MENVNESIVDQEDSKKKKTKKQRSAVSFMIRFFIKIGVTAVVVCLLCIFVVGIYINHSNASYPMIKDGDLCLTFKLANLYAGDAIAYKHDGKICFGRIVAMPGDVVDQNEGSLTVNGYGTLEDTVYPTTAEGITIALPYTVPQETYFVLNDYRDDITDSRTFGAIPKSETKGKFMLLLRMRGF